MWNMMRQMYFKKLRLSTSQMRRKRVNENNTRIWLMKINFNIGKRDDFSLLLVMWKLSKLFLNRFISFYFAIFFFLCVCKIYRKRYKNSQYLLNVEIVDVLGRELEEWIEIKKKPNNNKYQESQKQSEMLEMLR